MKKQSKSLDQLTLEELDTRIAELGSAASEAEITFKLLTASADTSQDGLQQHSMARSKVDMLTRELEAAQGKRPLKEFMARCKAADDAEADFRKAQSELKTAEKEVEAILLQVMKPGYYLTEAKAHSFRLAPYKAAVQKSMNRWTTLDHLATNWGKERGLARPT